jgi:hypothetical protein
MLQGTGLGVKSGHGSSIDTYNQDLKGAPPLDS